MRKGMYGKLTMLAVAGVMALSGCGNSGGDTGTAAEPKGETTALAGTETEKALEEASQGGEGAVHWADGYYFCQHQRYPVHGSPGGGGFSVCNAEPPHL